MDKNSTYAVVDIETTGTNPKVDRIIQIGCVLIEYGEIVARFATDVNPGMKISKQIENLTGIKNSQAAKAPYFEDVAYTIYQLLRDCVFVAHNIYFDYTFLNHELKRCGVNELKGEGIDTVELAQIFLPTVASFRLSDLAESLELVHDRPHQADSDAEVTAKLLLVIEEQIKRLPLTTVEKIVELSELCGMDTGSYIQMIFERMKENVLPLSPSLKIIQGLALKKKEVSLFSYSNYQKSVYPASKKAKETLYQRKFAYRSTQAKMMNMVHHFFSNEVEEDTGKNLAIEAATGLGKTLGYLFPLSYLATPKNPAIISTVSIVLESQILEKDIPLLKQVSKQNVQAVLVKSHRHFIDLASFVETLKRPVKQKQYALFQMRILVWLIGTDTGDLDELQLTSFNHIFWHEVRHRGLEFLGKSSAFYEEDFLLFLHKKIKQANIIIVNHAFLCQEDMRDEPILPESSYLVIDEAHHLPDVARRLGTKHCSSESLLQLALQLQEEEGFYADVTKIIQAEKSWIRENQLLTMIVIEAAETLTEMSENFFLAFQEQATPRLQEMLLTEDWLENRPLSFQKNLQRLFVLLDEGAKIWFDLRQDFINNIDKWSSSEGILISQWLSSLKILNQLKEFFLTFFKDSNEALVKWCALNEKKQLMTFYYQDFEAPTIETKKWYDRYGKILYTGGTIRVGKDTQFLARELGISTIPFKSLPDPYDYQSQARLFVPTDGCNISTHNTKEYAVYLGKVIQELSEQLDKPILVLFTSHDLLQQVYYKIHMGLLTSGREVLAQGVSGSREKIMKRFVSSNNSILLGADSFWEGVDLPGDTLEVIVITRLPFESPERPFVKAKYHYLEKQGINAFYMESLPKAALRLRQGFGRLIRSETDRGVMLILDERIIKAKYGKKILRTLPKELIVKNESIAEIFIDIKEFLKNQEN